MQSKEFLYAGVAAAVTAITGNEAPAQQTYPEITTPGFSEGIDSLITARCPGGIYDPNGMASSIKCADVTLESTAQILKHVSGYIKDHTGKGISPFWAGAAQAELLFCARPLDNAQNKPGVYAYDIVRGDTLSEIVADHYNLKDWPAIKDVYEIVARNNAIQNPDLIYAGQSLVLFDDPNAKEPITSTNDKVLSYLMRAHDVAVNCMENIDNAENGIGAWVDTPAQNHLIAVLNCQTTPETCTRLPMPEPKPGS